MSPLLAFSAYTLVLLLKSLPVEIVDTLIPYNYLLHVMLRSQFKLPIFCQSTVNNFTTKAVPRKAKSYHTMSITIFVRKKADCETN